MERYPNGPIGSKVPFRDNTSAVELWIQYFSYIFKSDLFYA